MTQLQALSMVVLEDVDALFTNHREADHNNSSLRLGSTYHAPSMHPSARCTMPESCEHPEVFQWLPKLLRRARGSGRCGDLYDHEPPGQAGARPGSCKLICAAWAHSPQDRSEHTPFANSKATKLICQNACV